MLGGNIFVSYDVEPFLQSVAAQSTDAAYPHSTRVLPLNLYFAWPLFISDALVKKAITDSANVIRQAAIAEGQPIADLPSYPNYALEDAPIESLYGGNVVRLKAIKQMYDPKNVMGRAGGYKF